ncbi:MAG: Na(+)-translocating NADH-quinone reductase subunit C [Chlamydiales bacterium]|nr:Na(+)-translocating NADH-quinone reductase subunit C [Chlamydiales bacterium]
MQDPSKRAPHTDFQVLLFISSLCVICALALAVVAYVLSTPQKEAKEFDQRKQMLIAAKILSHSGYFELLDDESKPQIAQFDPSQMILVADPEAKKATEDQIKQVAESRIRPLLTDKEGNIYSLEEKKITLTDYLEKNKKTGYANLPLKLFYAILPNKSDAQNITASELAKDPSQIYAYVIPVSGFGLWAPIYGYLAVGKNGDEVIGTTWYDHGETPGLGANITEAWWQDQFYKKLIFQESSSGTTDFQTTDMGLIVVKGKVLDVFGSSPKSKSAVDGISGATLTGDGVTQAYRNSLQPYREFLIKVNKGFND